MVTFLAIVGGITLGIIGLLVLLVLYVVVAGHLINWKTKKRMEAETNPEVQIFSKLGTGGVDRYAFPANAIQMTRYFDFLEHLDSFPEELQFEIMDIHDIVKELRLADYDSTGEAFDNYTRQIIKDILMTDLPIAAGLILQGVETGSPNEDQLIETFGPQLEAMKDTLESIHADFYAKIEAAAK